MNPIDELRDELRALKAELHGMKRRELAWKQVRRWSSRIAALTALGLLSIPVVGLALPDLPQASPGDTITAASWNSNFQILVDAITSLENSQVDERLLSIQVDGIAGTVTATTSGAAGTTAMMHAGGAVDVSFPPGMFGSAPTCVATHAEPTNNNVAYHLENVSEIGILVSCRVTVNGSISSQGCNEPVFNLLCVGNG